MSGLPENHAEGSAGVTSLPATAVDSSTAGPTEQIGPYRRLDTPGQSVMGEARERRDTERVATRLEAERRASKRSTSQSARRRGMSLASRRVGMPGSRP